ncbi:MAG: type IV pilus assembly protein PilM [Candidatus Levybacteria bacterium]|nr:type IV pilus assembly protein PilM [Candidatus Levybacteria bacterium]
MNTRPFGLEIGAVTMKAVWLSGEKGRFSISAIVQAPTPLKGMLSESPFDQETMAQSIKQMLMQGKITTPYVNIALPDSQVYTRVIEIPLLSDQELASAIYWEAEQYIPLPLGSVTLDWTVLDKPANSNEGKKMQVLLVGAPTMLLNKYQKILALAGLTINVVETEILSTIRPIIQGEHNPDSIVVHIGDLSTSFAIIKSGGIVFSYSVATGGVALVRSIASDFGVSVAQAEEYKNAYGVSKHGVGEKIGKATEPILMSIITEIKKALAFYAQKYGKDSVIQQILLSGGNAHLPGIDIFFAQNCGIETVTANPISQLGIDSSLLPKQIIDKAADFTIAFGLGMREYE